MDLITLCAWGSAIIDAFVAAAVFALALRGAPPRLGFGRACGAGVAAAVAGGVTLAGKAALATVFGVGPFGLIHFAYLWVALLPPTLGIMALRRAVPRLRGAGRVAAGVLAIGGLLPPLVCAYGSFVEPTWLRAERHDVPIAGLLPGAPPIRVVVLADIQTDRVDDYQRRVMARALAEEPDLILLPGDFFHCSQETFQRRRADFLELLRLLDGHQAVYACLGNVDPPARTQRLLDETNIRLLRNQTEVVEIRGVRVAIGGVDWRYSSPRGLAAIRGMRAVDADVRLLLTHTPDAATATSDDDRIDLIISGHTHGGQVQVPGFGPLVTNSLVPRHVAAGGLHTLGEQRVYISRGLGMERLQAPPLRLFCRPELTVLTLCGTSDPARDGGSATSGPRLQPPP